ncbi:MAG TPA: hypothetical protein VMQ44_03145 [Candidatus Saccharimonadales bacterium]|nr:hypothetical protein [Candidatus Saccharimonadales bacterium]
MVNLAVATTLTRLKIVSKGQRIITEQGEEELNQLTKLIKTYLKDLTDIGSTAEVWARSEWDRLQARPQTDAVLPAIRRFVDDLAHMYAHDLYAHILRVLPTRSRQELPQTWLDLDCANDLLVARQYYSALGILRRLKAQIDSARSKSSNG